MRKNILWMIPLPEKKVTGGEEYLYELRKKLIEHGFSVIPVNLVIHKLLIIRILAGLRNMFDPAIGKNSILIQQVGGAGANCLANIAIKLLKGSRIVINVKEYRYPRSISELLRYLLLFIYFRTADLIVVNSSFISEWVQKFGISSKKVLLCPPFLRQMFFGHSNYYLEKSYKNMPTRLLCVSNMTADKGQAELIKAFSFIRQNSLELRLIGAIKDQRYYDGLKCLVKELGVSNIVSIIGYREGESLIDEYKNADIFVFPTKREGFGMALFEAMFMGLPCITSRAGGMKDFATDGENCIYVEPSNIPQLREAITRLIGDANLRMRIGRSAARTAREYDQHRPKLDEYIKALEKL